MNRQMLLHIPGLFRYTDRLAAEIILRDGLKAGAQLTRGGRSDVHTTLFCPQDKRGDGIRRIGEILDHHEVAAVICGSARETVSTGRLNPSDGVCLWTYLPPSLIDAVLLVWRNGDGQGGWGHRIIYDSSLPAADRNVDFPGKKVESFASKEKTRD